MARPLTKDESAIIKKEFLKALRENDGFAYKTCKIVGVPYQTHHYWMETDKDYAKEVLAINEFLKDEAESILRNKIREKDTTSLIFWLKTKAKDRGYVERMEQTGKDGGAIESKTESIITQNTIPLAQNILKDYEKVILNGKDKPSESTASKPH